MGNKYVALLLVCLVVAIGVEAITLEERRKDCYDYCYNACIYPAVFCKWFCGGRCKNPILWGKLTCYFPCELWFLSLSYYILLKIKSFDCQRRMVILKRHICSWIRILHQHDNCLIIWSYIMSLISIIKYFNLN